MNTTRDRLTPVAVLPTDHAGATRIGRAWMPGRGGPSPVLVRADGIHDLSGVAPTVSELLELDSPVAAIRAAGVLPRADASRAEAVRKAVVEAIGDNPANVRPGSPDAARLKDVLVAQGLWSRHLEICIGPDAEIFTKSQPLSVVGVGAEVGIHPQSEWNNAKPDVVLAINSRGQVVGATLGNDVNLRDFEDRSALLLGKAKDNNASCAIGPFIRLFDGGFGIDDVRACEVMLRINGLDGFALIGSSAMSMINRDPLDLTRQSV